MRRMPPAEAGLIATIEVVLAPLWVWIFFAESPGRATIYGGAIVVAAVLFHLSGDLTRFRETTGGSLSAAEGKPEFL